MPREIWYFDARLIKFPDMPPRTMMAIFEGAQSAEDAAAMLCPDWLCRWGLFDASGVRDAP